MKRTLPITRRTVLRAAGSAVALPFFDSLGFGRRATAAAVAARPKRMVFLGFGWGVTNETWFPDGKQTGKDYKLSEGLKPLERHRDRFTVIQGLSNKFANEAHWGSTFWLTGANRYGEPGKSFANSVSADQVAAAAWGDQTRFASLQLGTLDAGNSGHGPGLSLAWDSRGRPLAGLDTPVLAFHRLFSAEGTSLEERQAALSAEQSVLDAVRADAGRVRRGLSAADTDKLDEYLQSVRDIETRLAKEKQWLTVPKPAPAGGLGAPKENIAGQDEIKVMYDILVAALETDSTRVISYRQPVGTLLKGLGINVAPHDMSHYQPGERMEASKKRDATQSELLAGLLDRLAAVKESDGTSLLDNTTLVYGSNIRSIHYLDNCPTLVAGGGSGIRLGEHVVVPDKTPLANLWLTLLKGAGVKAESHGDSTGVVKELFS
ncbi:MAG: DUF1552 domain-containing protein [Planctomycetia bacterium]|nr:DUF1552 domain-containing protein [Planctomycetia bacterium]